MRSDIVMVRLWTTIWILVLCWSVGAPLHAASEAMAADAGRDVYLAQCARCHQPDGRGVEGLYPSLHDLSVTAASRQAVIQGLLQGRRGTLDTQDGRFDNLMPAHGYLGNETIAATLSYVLSAWGEGDGVVRTEDVAAARLDLLAAHPRASEALPAPSPLADMDATQYVTSAGPALTIDEFDHARRLYYGHCTGCHGVLREGVAGNPLTPELMRERGTEYLQSVISFGSSSGMPNWGSAETLSAEDINVLARFLQHPVPQPPDMSLAAIRDSWHLRRASGERPERPLHGYDLGRMFVAILHDTGEIALIDGADKTVLTRVDVGRAPHRVAASASGRYLYVIGRDGTVSLVDLYASPPARVASVRVGYEARTIAASAYPGYEDALALAGAYWPPQLVMLDGSTLEPLRLISTRGYTRDHRYHPEPRVSDITASRAHPEFIGQIKETGRVLMVPYDTRAGLLTVQELDAGRELRAGSYASDGRHYLTPTDVNAINVLDVASRTTVAEIPARAFGGNAGVAYEHATLGPVWVTSTMVNPSLLVVGTDPVHHPDRAWRLLQEPATPATGSLFLAVHPDSAHVWMDMPLSADPAHSQSAAVFDKDDLEAGAQSLPVAAWSGLTSGPRRVLQPTYSENGREVWFAVWNPQDQGSAVVVVDDATLEPVATIRTPELITVTRLYSLASLRAHQRAAAGPASAANASMGRGSGAELYAAHCTSCHGVYGEGDGPMAPSLASRPLDLRYLSERNDGEFPRAFVREIIDGRSSRAAHGPADMPVWGAVLARDPDGDGRRPVDALVDFLESIQL